MQFNEGWNVEPNAPEPVVRLEGMTLRLCFALDEALERYAGCKKGMLTFTDCVQYRLGPPNDQGFYVYGDSRFKQHGVRWGDFYPVENGDWVSKPSRQDCGWHRGRAVGLQPLSVLFPGCGLECVARAHSFAVV